MVLLVVAAGVIFGVPRVRHDVFTSPTTAPPTTAPLTPEQQFASDVTAQIPQLATLVKEGVSSRDDLEVQGDFVCNNLTNPEYGGYASFVTSVEVPPPNGAPGLSPFAAELLVSLAIEDICPSQVADISYGYPGAP